MGKKQKATEAWRGDGIAPATRLTGAAETAYGDGYRSAAGLVIALLYSASFGGITILVGLGKLDGDEFLTAGTLLSVTTIFALVVASGTASKAVVRTARKVIAAAKSPGEL